MQLYAGARQMRLLRRDCATIEPAFFVATVLPRSVGDSHLTGLLLILLGFGLLAAEIVILPGSGLLVLSGLAVISIGAILLMSGATGAALLAPWALAFVVGIVAAVYVVTRRGVLAAARRSPVTGREGMIGEEGVALADLDPRGQVFVHGEIWEATTPGQPIRRGSSVRVVGLEGLSLHVELSVDPVAVENK
jgi:membrane-bound serine protease (ClpP class)